MEDATESLAAESFRGKRGQATFGVGVHTWIHRLPVPVPTCPRSHGFLRHAGIPSIKNRLQKRQGPIRGYHRGPGQKWQGLEAWAVVGSGTQSHDSPISQDSHRSQVQNPCRRMGGMGTGYLRELGQERDLATKRHKRRKKEGVWGEKGNGRRDRIIDSRIISGSAPHDFLTTGAGRGSGTGRPRRGDGR